MSDGRRWRARTIWTCLECGGRWVGREPLERPPGTCGINWRWEVIGAGYVEIRHRPRWALEVVRIS